MATNNKINNRIYIADSILLFIGYYMRNPSKCVGKAVKCGLEFDNIS